jgi:tetratricopeptide (TPR) repeat protein
LRQTQTILPIALILTLSSAYSQQLPYSRRMSSVTPTFLGLAERKITPIQPGTRKGSVLVVFRTSEQGAVIDARGVEGRQDLQQAAVDAINQWKFKATSVGGQPVQMGSAVIVDFSETPPAIQVPKPMTARQLALGLQFECLNALLHQDSNSLTACEQQLAAVDHDSRSTSMDRFTAHDEYGLALMNYGQDREKAVEQFTEAIHLAPQRFKSSDAEWAYAFWHRAAAEQQMRNNADADKDFSTAETSMQGAENLIGDEKMAAYYRGLLGKLVKQHATLLESEGKHEEATALFTRFKQ